jgi:hypothetical protein
LNICKTPRRTFCPYTYSTEMKPDWYVDPSIEERDPFVFDLMKAYKVRMVEEWRARNVLPSRSG